VVEGKCTACHNPHGTKLEYQLVNQPREVCLVCHQKIVTTTARKGHIEMEEGDCLSCHHPHDSDLRKLLEAEDPGLCMRCHGSDAERLSTVHRMPLAEISRCTSCHEPHVSAGEGLLKEVLHDPFGRRDCIACHE
jgi:predicted CXXCH cytochrome family protein